MRESLTGRDYAEAFLKVTASCIENSVLETIVAGMGGEITPDSPDLAKARQVATDLHDRSWIGFDAYGDVVRLHALVKQNSMANDSSAANVHPRLCSWYSNQHVQESSSTLQDAKFRILAVQHAIKTDLQEDLRRLLLGQFTSNYTFLKWLIAWGHLDAGIDLFSEAASAYNAAQQAVDAANVLDASIKELDQLVSQGRSDVQPLLALAHLNRVHAYLHEAHWEQSVAESDRSATFYAAAIAQGGLEFRGYLAHVLLDRAEALYRMDRVEESSADRLRGLSLSQQCIAHGGCIIRSPEGFNTVDIERVVREPCSSRTPSTPPRRSSTWRRVPYLTYPRRGPRLRSSQRYNARFPATGTIWRGVRSQLCTPAIVTHASD